MQCKLRLRQRDIEHYKEKETLKSDMDLQRELDAMRTERMLQKEKAKLKVRKNHISYRLSSSLSCFCV